MVQGGFIEVLAVLLSVALRCNRSAHRVPLVILVRVALGVLKIRHASFAERRRDTLWTLALIFNAPRLRPAVPGSVNVALVSANVTTEGASRRCLLAKRY